MTLRDKIMDKYWLEYIKVYKEDNGSFWYWFQSTIVSKRVDKLEDYLK